MESPSNAPSVLLIVKKAASTTGQAAVETLARELKDFNIPVTWVIEEPKQAKFLAERQLLSSRHELAIVVAARSPQRLRNELTNAQATVQAVSRHEVTTVVGDPQQLRARAALLADLGIRAVLAESQLGRAKPPRPLPCGLWQLDPTVTIPQPRRLWSLLAGHRVTAKQLLDSAPQQVLALDLEQAGGRDLNAYRQLLREIADAVQRQQLCVATISTLVGQLASRNEMKPQRSILRAA